MNRKDHLKKYYQKNGRFQEKKDKNSIGLCIISNYREDVVISLTEKEISFEEALKAKNLPDPIALLYACNRYNDWLNIDPSKYISYWITVDNSCIDMDFGDIPVQSSRFFCSIDSNNGVGYLDNNYYPGSYYNSHYGPRLYREMWRIKK